VRQLQTRLARLEQRLGHCPDCANRPAEIELVPPGQAAEAKRQADPVCASCGERGERILVLLAFDPDLGTTT
jgi:hypothetical protein